MDRKNTKNYREKIIIACVKINDKYEGEKCCKVKKEVNEIKLNLKNIGMFTDFLRVECAGKLL